MIYLLRHGQTQYNLERRIQGQCDSDLTALGREQARAMGRTLRAHVPPDTPIVCSPLGRTVASAKLVREEAGIVSELTTDPLLLEVGCGSWETRLSDECRAEAGAARDVPFLDVLRHHCPDGEGFENARSRAARWLEKHDGQPVVAVAHGLIGLMLRDIYLGLDDLMVSGVSSTQDRFFRLHDGRIEELLAS